MTLHLFSTLLLASLQPAQIGPPVPVPPPARNRDCQPAEESDEIVVCGENSEDSPYRVPRRFRNQRSDDDVHASWSSRVNDEEAIGRFSDQVSGPGAYLQSARQRDCQWRAARQEAQGRRPDCGARVRPNEPADYQRR